MLYGCLGYEFARGTRGRTSLELDFTLSAFLCTRNKSFHISAFKALILPSTQFFFGVESKYFGVYKAKNQKNFCYFNLDRKVCWQLRLYLYAWVFGELLHYYWCVCMSPNISSVWLPMPLRQPIRDLRSIIESYRASWRIKRHAWENLTFDSSSKVRGHFIEVVGSMTLLNFAYEAKSSNIRRFNIFCAQLPRICLTICRPKY